MARRGCDNHISLRDQSAAPQKARGRGLAVWLGPARGYLAGFLFYWIRWCFLLSLLTVGPGGLREMFKAPHSMFGKPNWLGLFILHAI